MGRSNSQTVFNAVVEEGRFHRTMETYIPKQSRLLTRNVVVWEKAVSVARWKCPIQFNEPSISFMSSLAEVTI